MKLYELILLFGLSFGISFGGALIYAGADAHRALVEQESTR